MSDQYRFSGFPAQGLALLEELTSNNNKLWFESHKAAILEHVITPAQYFVLTLGMRLRTMVPDLRVDPRADGGGVLLRMYRDTRFSHDPSPYKTNVAGIFWAGPGKKMTHTGFGFQLDPTGMRMMTGIFTFQPQMLRAYRQAVVDDELGAELEQALTAIQQAGPYEIVGHHYKRVPAGFPADHPRAALLLCNGLYASPPPLPPESATTPDIVDRCFVHFQQMSPLYHWLRRVEEDLAN